MASNSTTNAPFECNPDRLVELARSGDENALDALTRCYGRRLVAVGRQVCGNTVDADDAIQDALLAAGQNVQSFRGEGSLEGWLVRLVKNACHRMRRGRKNNASLHTTEWEGADGQDPEQQAGRGEMIERLGEALGDLSPQDRTILLLAEAEDWTAPEIAEALSLSAVAVRTRLMRVRRKLKASFSD